MALTPIARWNFVPYQRITAPTKIGVVAFSKAGIEKVAFSWDGGAAINATSMTYNSVSNAWEYWADFDPGDFSDGAVTLDATVTGDDAGTNALDQLTIYADDGGTIPQLEVWVARADDTPAGNDDTGALGNRNLPFLTIGEAAQAIFDSQADTDGGMIMGSAGAFLVLESREHAQARGAIPYARISKVVSDRCNRQAGAARKSAERLLEKVAEQIPEGPLAVLSGCCGVQPQLSEELGFLNDLSNRGITPAIRGVTTILGNTMEAQFPGNVILASLAISKGEFFDPFDSTGVEQDYSGKPERVLVSSWGHWRGESLALIDTPDVQVRGRD